MLKKSMQLEQHDLHDGCFHHEGGHLSGEWALDKVLKDAFLHQGYACRALAHNALPFVDFCFQFISPRFILWKKVEKMTRRNRKVNQMKRSVSRDAMAKIIIGIVFKVLCSA